MPPEPSLEGFSFESSAAHAASHALSIKPIWSLEVEGLQRGVPYFSSPREGGRWAKQERGRKVGTSEIEGRNTTGQSSESGKGGSN